ncbi:MAG: acyltransferase [Desulfofustis sp.]|jgi:peptidoglycan/LPS O-acetylase OafA/YrhL|nr:acyltransferase [Desulfofustis sp.]
MNYLSSTTVKVILAVLLFVLIRAVVSSVALSSFSAIFVDAEFSRDSVVEVFYAASESIGFRPQFRKTSATISSNQRAETRIMLSNHVVRRLRVDIGTGPAVVKLYSIRLLSRFGPGMTFDFRQIFERFTPNEAITSFTLDKDHVLIKTDGLDPYLVLKNPLVQRNRALEYGLPFAFALFSYLLLGRFSPGRIPAIGDITTKQSSSGINIGSLDGVRGLAALLVLGQHCGLTATGGIFGVWLFFCLSGFLLATPFVKQPGLALSGTYMADYLTRRIKRIVPMYYVMIVITFLFAGKIETAVRHFLFIQADGHFWSIPQEMFFYLLLPLVMIANFVIARKNLLVSTLVLALTAFFASSLLTRDVIALYGNNAIQKAQAGIFITGSTAAFLYSLLIGKYRTFFSKPAVRWTSSTCGLLILGVCLALSATKHGTYGHLTPTEKPFYFGIAASLLILSTLLAKGSYLDKLMNLLPLRAVGVVGYSFYLLHPAMIDSVRSATVYFADYYPVRTGLFILAGIATYVVSIFTYSYIERPFIKK